MSILPRPMPLVPVMAIAALALAACNATELGVVRTKAAANLECPEESITVVKLRDKGEGTTYEAEGCDERRRYYCWLDRDQVAGRAGTGARGNMRFTTECRELPR